MNLLIAHESAIWGGQRGGEGGGGGDWEFISCDLSFACEGKDFKLINNRKKLLELCQTRSTQKYNSLKESRD